MQQKMAWNNLYYEHQYNSLETKGTKWEGAGNSKMEVSEAIWGTPNSWFGIQPTVHCFCNRCLDQEDVRGTCAKKKTNVRLCRSCCFYECSPTPPNFVMFVCGKLSINIVRLWKFCSVAPTLLPHTSPRASTFSNASIFRNHMVPQGMSTMAKWKSTLWGIKLANISPHLCSAFLLLLHPTVHVVLLRTSPL